jgi:hypothetical protein
MKITVDQSERPEQQDPISRSFKTFQAQMELQRRGGAKARFFLGIFMVLMAVLFALAGIAFVVWGAIALILMLFQRLFGREKKVTITTNDPHGPR